MKYRKGSKVKIKEYHKLLGNSDDYQVEINGFVGNMKKYCGKTAIITEVYETSNGVIWVRLDVDGGFWNWNADWLDHLSYNMIDLPDEIFQI